MAIGKRIICLVMAVIFSLPVFMQPAFASEIANGQSDVYVGMIDVPIFAHSNINNLINGSNISGHTSGEGTLIYYNQSGTMMPMYCVEPGKSLSTGDNISLLSYISELTNSTLTNTLDIEKMLGRLFLYAYTDKASSATEQMAQYFASQLLVWEIVVGERDEFFNHVSNQNGSNVTDVLQSMNSSVASKVKSYYDSYVTSMQNNLKIPSFCKLRANSAETYTVSSNGTVTLTDTNNVVSNFTVSVTNGSATVSGNTLTIKADDAKTAVVTLSKTVNTNRHVMFCYGTSSLQNVVSVGELEADPRVCYVNVKGNETGTLDIVKTSEDGIIANIEFTVTGNGETYSVKTDKNGEISIPNLKAGTYTVTEKVPVRYDSQQSKTVTVQPGKTASVSFANTLKKGSIKINKQAEDGEIGGRTFVITGNGKTYTINTNPDGIAVLSDIPVYDSNDKKITYTISEKNVPVKYVVPADQTATLMVDATTSKIFKNVLKKFTVSVTKKDSESGTAQGDGTLSGAVYGLYKDGKLVDTYTTDQNGAFTTKEYACGNYTIKEISPSEGYLLDDTVYSVGAEPKNYTIENNALLMTVYEKVVKGKIAIIKHNDDGSTKIETPEVGAEFQIYLKSAGSFDNAKDTEKDVLVCDNDGFAQSKELPYGIYVVHQTKGNEGAEFMSDFTVNINENGKTYRYLINNATFTALVKIVKKDAETGKVIPVSGIGFKVKDKSTGEYISQSFNYPQPTTLDTFYTDESGSLMLPEELPYGEYELEEVSTANGYWLGNETVSFKVDGTEQVITVEKFNTAQKGRISIHKTGNVFSSVAIASSASLDQNGKEVINPTTYSPIFVEKSLSNAVFDVIASEDIITADGTIRAKAGDIVAELTTDESGYAQTDLLYLGKYEIREKTAPFGYILNTNPQYVELSYAGQEVEVRDTMNTSFFDDYQGIAISLAKVMEQDEKFGIGNNLEYTNVRFGLFADEEIIASDGTSIPKDGLIAEMSLNEDMTARFETPIPYGKYYVQEISTDEHYVLNGEKYLVSFEYMGQNIPTVSVDCGKFVNVLKRGNFNGLKIDEETKSPLANAVFGLFKTTATEYTADNAILTATSDENGCFSFAYIPYGEYIVHEIKAPDGYVLSDKSYPVTVSDDGDVIEITAENKPGTGTVEITKSDVSDGTLIPNCGIEILDKNGNAIFQGRTDKNGVVKFENLRYGEYFYREFDAPKGYILDEKAYPFSIKENGEIVKCQMTNTKIPVVPDTPVTPKTPVIPDTPSSSSPKTGDNSNVSLWLITTCIALGVSMFTLKKKNIKEKFEYENDDKD